MKSTQLDISFVPEPARPKLIQWLADRSPPTKFTPHVLRAAVGISPETATALVAVLASRGFGRLRTRIFYRALPDIPIRILEPGEGLQYPFEDEDHDVEILSDEDVLMDAEFELTKPVKHDLLAG